MGGLKESDATTNGSQIVVAHEFGHILGLRHPSGELTTGYDFVGNDPQGHAVNGPVDLMGSGMGLRPFYFDKWKAELDKRYNPDSKCKCNYQIK
jgi:hypothetical protein